MKLAKRTYALPSDTVSKFEEAVRPGRRSAKIAELIDIWMQERAREALRRNVAEGCCEMWDVYRETAQEWQPLEDEVDRHLDR